MLENESLGSGSISSTIGNLPSTVLLLLVVLVTPTVGVVLSALYNAYLHPLRNYPGPLLWRSFRIPYVISTQKGELHNRLKTFHSRYGSVVRIAPNELSYADARAWKDIYLNRPNHRPFERNRTWFKKMTPDEPNSILGFDEDDHARFRRAFANSFSEKSLKVQAPVVEGHVDLFIEQLKKLSKNNVCKETSTCIDLEQWFNYLTFDISGDLSFGESFDCLKDGRAHPWVEIAQDFGKGLALIASINQYPPIDKLLRYVIPKKVLRRSMLHREISAAKAKKRLELDTDRPDFVTPTKKYADKKDALSVGEWQINMLVIAFAASETTASALTAIVRELVQHRGVLYRLIQEVREAFENESELTIASTSNLTYLNAVINEGMRLDPPVVIGVPRTVPPGGDSVCGQYVPGGTYVTYNQYSANRQAYNFRNPNTFVPERFLNADPEDDMSSYQPFQMGRHVCLGMKHAYAEMRLALARLVFAFDLRLESQADRWDWGSQKTYIFWEKRPLKVLLTPVQHT